MNDTAESRGEGPLKIALCTRAKPFQKIVQSCSQLV